MLIDSPTPENILLHFLHNASRMMILGIDSAIQAIDSLPIGAYYTEGRVRLVVLVGIPEHILDFRKGRTSNVFPIPLRIGN